MVGGWFGPSVFNGSRALQLFGQSSLGGRPCRAVVDDREAFGQTLCVCVRRTVFRVFFYYIVGKRRRALRTNVHGLTQQFSFSSVGRCLRDGHPYNGGWIRRVVTTTQPDQRGHQPRLAKLSSGTAIDERSNV